MDLNTLYFAQLPNKQNTFLQYPKNTLCHFIRKAKKEKENITVFTSHWELIAFYLWFPSNLSIKNKMSIMPQMH